MIINYLIIIYIYIFTHIIHLGVGIFQLAVVTNTGFSGGHVGGRITECPVRWCGIWEPGPAGGFHTWVHNRWMVSRCRKIWENPRLFGGEPPFFGKLHMLGLARFVSDMQRYWKLLHITWRCHFWMDCWSIFGLPPFINQKMCVKFQGSYVDTILFTAQDNAITIENDQGCSSTMDDHGGSVLDRKKKKKNEWHHVIPAYESYRSLPVFVLSMRL